jgi:hypothetical protein
MAAKSDGDIFPLYPRILERSPASPLAQFFD